MAPERDRAGGVARACGAFVKWRRRVTDLYILAEHIAGGVPRT